MEKFLLKRRTISLETWQYGILVIVAVLSVVGFGALVEFAGSSSDRASGISKLALQIARLPVNGRRITKEILTHHKNALTNEQRFEGEAGFRRFKNSDDEALLLTRYDGDKDLSVVELMDLEDGSVLHRYDPDFRDLLNRSKLEDDIAGLPRVKNPHDFTISHPILAEDGGLIFHGMNTPLTKVDVCSNFVWMVDKVFHHSLERDAEGNYWSSIYLDPPHLPNMPRTWHDDAIIQISPDGKVLYEKSLAEILIENDLSYLVYSGNRYDEDPLHLNDVQPVMTDGPYWHRGDLLLSLRHSSAIMFYRPSTNKILWLRQGPWMMQHDVDILNDHQIAIFNNNTGALPWGHVVLGVNETMIYDFSTDEIKAPFSEGYTANNIRTAMEGRSEILPDGEIFVEETNHGRLLQMNTAGEVTWQYINRASDGRNYIVNWTRYLDKALATRTADIAAQNCNP